MSPVKSLVIWIVFKHKEKKIPMNLELKSSAWSNEYSVFSKFRYIHIYTNTHTYWRRIENWIEKSVDKNEDLN